MRYYRGDWKSGITAYALPLLALAVLLFASEAKGADIQVQNCNDSGPGSIREAVDVAASGDVIDLRTLSCSRIVLESGRLGFWQDDLTFIGPGRDSLAIDGAYGYFPAIYHFGRGTLRIEGVTIENSRHKQGAHENGGCVSSLGSVQLVRSSVHHCLLHVEDDTYWSEEGRGGAIYAAGDLLVDGSRVHDSQIILFGFGGALYAGGSVTVLDSQIYDNSAYYGGAISSRELTVRNSVISGNRARAGGGIYASGPVLIQDSTIAGNSASEPQHRDRDDGLIAGAMYALDGATIVNSTISGNSAEVWSALYLGRGASVPSSTILNSTIAFNESSLNCAVQSHGAVQSYRDIHLESTIIARNTCAGTPGVDFGTSSESGQVVGTHNLIEITYRPVPADTISADPRLAPLAHNDGMTPTHHLLWDSPAIDQGNNILDLPYDQRGDPFVREQGAATDIGAVERQW